MKRVVLNSGKILHFSHWCGKGYAVFAALGQQVRIAALALNICRSALQKSARKGVIVSSDACPEEEAEIRIKLKLQDQMRNMLISGREVRPDEKAVLKYRKGRAVGMPFLFYSLPI